MILQLEINDIRHLISWPYFEHAWGVSGKEDAARLREEAEQMLDRWQGQYHCHAIIEQMAANSDDEDIIILAGDNREELRLPMLRQQEQRTDGSPMLCLADYIRPASSGVKDRVGVFCASVDSDIEELQSDDPYTRMLAQTLADRLAEATAEKVGETMPGIRPAVGYPSMPDMSLNFIINDLIGMETIGIRLTESGMMIPHASVSGIIISHPKAEYFMLGKIGEDQIADYASRRGMTTEEVSRFIKSY